MSAKPLADVATTLSQAATVKYSFATRLLHHGSVLLLLLLWLLLEFDDELYAWFGIHAVVWHEAFGVLFLLWLLGRLVNVLCRPKLPKSSAPKWQSALVYLTHAGLYLCMLAMPLCGIFMSLYLGRAVDVFGLVKIPVFVSPDRSIANTFYELHTELVFSVLVVLAALHAAAALYHLLRRDGIVGRMF